MLPPQTFHLDVKSDIKAIDLLAQNCELSKQQLKDAMHKGAVWLTDGKHTRRFRRAAKALKPGQQLHLYYNPDVLTQTTEPAVLIEDCQDYSVWYKPYGMLSQGSKWSDHTTITRFAELNLEPQRNAFLVHRLDRAASGLILVGHSKKTTAALCKLFEQRQLDKRYQVIVHGKFPDSQTITTPIDDKNAVSHASLLEYDEQQNLSRVEVKIETGRKHQIRLHMAGAGHPVVGDRFHGRGEQDGRDLQLCAVSLAIDCPVRQQPVSWLLPEALLPVL